MSGYEEKEYAFRYGAQDVVKHDPGGDDDEGIADDCDTDEDKGGGAAENYKEVAYC